MRKALATLSLLAMLGCVNIPSRDEIQLDECLGECGHTLVGCYAEVNSCWTDCGEGVADPDACMQACDRIEQVCLIRALACMQDCVIELEDVLYE